MKVPVLASLCIFVLMLVYQTGSAWFLSLRILWWGVARLLLCSSLHPLVLVQAASLSVDMFGLGGAGQGVQLSPGVH